MPVHIVSKGKEPRLKDHKAGFDQAVEALVPMIKQFRSEGSSNIRELAKRLNAAGRVAPSGRPFTYTTMRRVLKRMNELHLGPGPRSLSTAASQRTPRPYQPRRNYKRLFANGLKKLSAAGKQDASSSPGTHLGTDPK
jgi:hypothetical protein